MKSYNYEDILAWLDNEMPQRERQQFETAMQQRPELAEEVELAREALAAQQETEVLNLRETLSNIMDEEAAQGAKEGQRPKMNWIWWAAGLLTIAILLIIWLNYAGNKNDSSAKGPASPVALYETYYEKPGLLIASHFIDSKRTETNEETGKKVLEKIEDVNRHFSEGDLNAATTSLRELNATDSLEKYLPASDLLLAEGILLLQRDQPAAALKVFEESEADRPNEMAQWYMALSYLRMGDIGQVKKMLQRIEQQPFHPKREAAERLSRQLQSY